MLFFDPDPKVPLSMLPHISSLLWMTTTAKVMRRIGVIGYQNRDQSRRIGGNPNKPSDIMLSGREYKGLGR